MAGQQGHEAGAQQDADAAARDVAPHGVIGLLRGGFGDQRGDGVLRDVEPGIGQAEEDQRGHHRLGQMGAVMETGPRKNQQRQRGGATGIKLEAGMASGCGHAAAQPAPAQIIRPCRQQDGEADAQPGPRSADPAHHRDHPHEIEVAHHPEQRLARMRQRIERQSGQVGQAWHDLSFLRAAQGKGISAPSSSMRPAWPR
jgi:hypothetical protein